jgi:serine/threonine protein kinase
MASQAASQANSPLPEGTRLQKYRIVRVLAAGGFSFVYLAHDQNKKPVAIKEYLPATLALRANGTAQPKVPAQDLAKFRFGMKCFFEEAGALAHLSHPNVMRVLDFFRANDTVYLVMNYERGKSLQEYIKTRAAPVEEIWLRNTFAQLLDGLREVHTRKLLHLDIKPAISAARARSSRPRASSCRPPIRPVSPRPRSTGARTSVPGATSIRSVRPCMRASQRRRRSPRTSA